MRGGHGVGEGGEKRRKKKRKEGRRRRGAVLTFPQVKQRTGMIMVAGGAHGL